MSSSLSIAVAIEMSICVHGGDHFTVSVKPVTVTTCHCLCLRGCLFSSIFVSSLCGFSLRLENCTQAGGAVVRLTNMNVLVFLPHTVCTHGTTQDTEQDPKRYFLKRAPALDDAATLVLNWQTRFCPPCLLSQLEFCSHPNLITEGSVPFSRLKTFSTSEQRLVSEETYSRHHAYARSSMTAKHEHHENSRSCKTSDRPNIATNMSSMNDGHGAGKGDQGTGHPTRGKEAHHGVQNTTHPKKSQKHWARGRTFFVIFDFLLINRG